MELQRRQPSKCIATEVYSNYTPEVYSTSYTLQVYSNYTHEVYSTAIHLKCIVTIHLLFQWKVNRGKQPGHAAPGRGGANTVSRGEVWWGKRQQWIEKVVPVAGSQVRKAASCCVSGTQCAVAK